MAILYGTTAEGDSLPVEVNEFGQLVAVGVGEQGPPGAPGVGELPPDPFEGAILGWKDNKLAWLGGAVPLPEGTYGPILDYSNGVLTLADYVSIPYLTQIFLSDDQGNQYFYSPVSSPIVAVNGNVLTLADDRNLENFRVGDVLVKGSDYGRNGVMSGMTNHPETGTRIQDPVNLFDGNESSYWGYTGGNGNQNRPEPTIWTPTNPIPYNQRVEVLVHTGFGDPVGYYLNGNLGGLPTPMETLRWITFTEGSGFVESFGFYNTSGNRTNYVRFYAMRIDGNKVVDSPEVKITAIDEAAPSITTDGGAWQVGQDVVGPSKSGEGTVQTTSVDAIVLRENNDQWRVGEYVTAPAQNLAARYVYREEIKKKLL